MKRQLCIAFALTLGLTACEGTTDDPGTGDSDGGGGSGGITLSHAGAEVAPGSTYFIPDMISDPSSSAVAIFSEQKDRMVITNTSDSAVTIESITLVAVDDEQDEEMEVCDYTSGVNTCLAYTLPTLAAGETWDFYLHFYPVQSGRRSGTLTITFSGGSQTYDIAGHGRIGSDLLPAYFLENPSQSSHKLWGGYDNNHDEGPGPMVADTAGNVYFAGTASGHVGSVTSADRNIFVVKVNANGSLGWQKVYTSSYHDEIAQTGDDGGLGAADAMAIDAAGNIYVVGKAANGANTKTLGLILKIAPNGTEVWTRYWFGDTTRLQYTDSAANYAIDVVGDLIFLTGTGKADVSTQGIPVTCMGTDGTFKWSKMVIPYDAFDTQHRGHTIRYDGAGNLYIAGMTGTSGSSGPFIVKLTGVDDTGATVALGWTKLIGDVYGGSINSSDLDASGNLHLAVDRRGATTYFTVGKLSADGNTFTGMTMPGSAGDRNNIHVVRVVGDKLYAGGRIGLPGWDTGNGDGMIARFAVGDLSVDWGGVYYTGTGPNEVCAHTVQGIAASSTTMHVVGQVYTGNSNYYRYWGYWYDFPETPEAYAPTLSDATGTTLIDMDNAGLVSALDANFTNDGTFTDIAASMNIELVDADAKDETTTGSATDGDVFIATFGM